MPLFDDSSLPPELDSRVRAELRDGERLLWVGQPLPARYARAAWPMVLFGIPWTAFAVFWIVMAGGMGFFAANAGPGGPGAGGAALFGCCFPLFGVPFVLIGIGMLTSPIWLRRQARRTCYALTDRRAIVWKAQSFGGVEVRSYGPDDLTRLVRTENADGTGDLVFEEFVRTTRRYGNNGNRSTYRTRYGFLAIADVRRIEELLRRVLLPG
jgi:hypothetical protein